jgi:transposase
LRSEQQLMEQVAYNLLYRWFVGLAMDEAAWDATVYTKNRDRLLQGEVSQRLPVVVEGRINSKKRSGRE